MNSEQFPRELNFQISRYFIKRMHSNGIISEADFLNWQSLLIEKYDPPVGKIVSNTYPK